MKEKEYMSLCASMPCTDCHVHGVQLHHIRTGLTGMGKKASNWLVIPLCPDCHRKIHQNNMNSEKLLAIHIENVIRLIVTEGKPF